MSQRLAERNGYAVSTGEFFSFENSHSTPWPLPSPRKRIIDFFWFRFNDLIVSCNRRLGDCSRCGGSGSSMRAGPMLFFEGREDCFLIGCGHAEPLHHGIAHFEFLAIAVPGRCERSRMGDR